VTGTRGLNAVARVLRLYRQGARLLFAGITQAGRFTQESDMNPDVDQPVVLTENQATQGVKLGSVRYVLGISLFLATVAGVAIWNVFAK
jgi:hypothetical protein